MGDEQRNDRVKYYREKARVALSLAEATGNPDEQKAMVELSMFFDSLADMIERRIDHRGYKYDG